MSKEQINELAKDIYSMLRRDNLSRALASLLYDKGWRRQSEEYEKRIVNQREELRRLNKRITDLTQSREAWKKKAERVGKQLHEVLSKQTNGEWIETDDENGYESYRCSKCGREQVAKTIHCPNCGAKMKGGAE